MPRVYGPELPRRDALLHHLSDGCDEHRMRRPHLRLHRGRGEPHLAQHQKKAPVLLRRDIPRHDARSERAQLLPCRQRQCTNQPERLAGSLNLVVMQRIENRLFRHEVHIETALRQPRRLRNLLYARDCITALGKAVARRLQDLRASLLRGSVSRHGRGSSRGRARLPSRAQPVTPAASE